MTRKERARRNRCTAKKLAETGLNYKQVGAVMSLSAAYVRRLVLDIPHSVPKKCEVGGRASDTRHHPKYAEPCATWSYDLSDRWFWRWAVVNQALAA